MKKTLLIIFGNASILCAGAQKLEPSTTPVFNNNAVTNNSVNNNTGTPMVKDPVAANNPSYQAAIPINNQVNPLEAGTPQKQVPANQVVIVRESVPVVAPANTVVITQNNSVVPVNTTNAVKGDTVFNNAGNVQAVQSTVIYNKETGVDLQKTKQPVVTNATNTPGNRPLLQTYVSESVVNKFKTIYGDNLYDIRLIRSGKNQVNYIVRIKDNGLFQSIYINEDGSRVVN